MRKRVTDRNPPLRKAKKGQKKGGTILSRKGAN